MAGTVRGSVLLGVGVAVGFGAGVFGPGLWRAGRPAAKSALKAAMEGYAAARIAAARAREEVEDLAAEVAFEMGRSEGATAAQDAPIRAEADGATHADATA